MRSGKNEPYSGSDEETVNYLISVEKRRVPFFVQALNNSFYRGNHNSLPKSRDSINSDVNQSSPSVLQYQLAEEEAAVLDDCKSALDRVQAEIDGLAEKKKQILRRAELVRYCDDPELTTLIKSKLVNYDIKCTIDKKDKYLEILIMNCTDRNFVMGFFNCINDLCKVKIKRVDADTITGMQEFMKVTIPLYARDGLKLFLSEHSDISEIIVASPNIRK